jgi:hypothetical protein
MVSFCGPGFISLSLAFRVLERPIYSNGRRSEIALRRVRDSASTE